MYFPWRDAYPSSEAREWERVRPPASTGMVPDRFERLKYQHYVLSQLAVLKRPLAPIKGLLSPSYILPEVLDVGSGNGDWGRTLAKAYPHVRVVGLDREDATRIPFSPLNYHFLSADPLGGLPFPSHHFLYVHQRLLGASVPFHQWPGQVQELVRITVPGGWVELLEAGLTFSQAGPATSQMVQWCRNLAEARGVNLSCLKDLGTLLRKKGLVFVQSESIQLRIGKWAGRQGDLVAKALLASVAALRPWCLAYVSADHFDAAVTALPSEWDTFHAEYEVYRFVGKRPGKEGLHDPE